MLFSATMPGPIVTLARTFLDRPTHIRAEHANDSAVHERTTQYVYRAHALTRPSWWRACCRPTAAARR